MTIVQELRRRRTAAPRLHPLVNGVRDPWGEAPPPAVPKDPRVIAAVVLAAGGPAHYGIDDLRRAYMSVDDDAAREHIRAAADVLVDREAVPAA